MSESMAKSSSTTNEIRSLPERKVGMGEIEVASGAFRLRTLLGSCVGMMLYDHRMHVGGLAHIVLPNSNGQGTPPGKYADTALPELLRQIERMNGRIKHLTAKISGGANMFATKGPMSIGDQNVAAVELILKTAGIPILGRHCGGNQGRRLAFEVDTGRATIEIVGAATIEL